MFQTLIKGNNFTVLKGPFTEATQEQWEKISDQIIDWNVARSEKNYVKADAILKGIKEMGFKLTYHKSYFTLDNI